MKRADFENFRKRHELSDEWWVSVNNEVFEKLMTLEEVAELEYELPGRSIALLHPDCADDDTSEWVPFEFDGMSSLNTADITVPGAPNSDDLQLHRKVEMVAEQVSEMKLAITDLQSALKKIEGMMSEAISLRQLKQDLEERQRFIEDGEESLLAKTIRYEEQLAELEQIRENMSGMEEQRSA